MRLLAVSHSYPRRSATGYGIFIHRLHRALPSHGVDVDVLQLADWAPPAPLSYIVPKWRAFRAARRDLFDELDGVRIHHPLVVSPRPSRFFPKPYAERQRDTLIAYCRRHPELSRADAVIGHFMVPDGHLALDLARALGVPALAMAWGDDVHAWPAAKDAVRQQLVRVLSEVDTPIACSRQMVEDSNAWLDRPRSDWKVVYAGVDADAFTPPADRRAAREAAFADIPLARKATVRVMLTLAQPVEAKGYRELLAAWESVAPAAPEWRLVMAGNGWGNVDIPNEISSRGLEKSAVWLGPQSAERVGVLLKGSDAFALPSHNEGLSLSVLEAMATGLPTITTRVGGHAEVIQDGRDGWLVPPRDAAALARALRELVSSDAERRRRGQAGRAAAKHIGSPSDNAGRLAAIVREASRSRPRRAAAAS